MNAPIARDRNTIARRSAFTLLELLIVTGIVAVLLTISAAAVIRYIDVQKLYNTQSLLKKLHSRLDAQMRLVAQKAMQEPIGTGGTDRSSIQSTIMTMANNNTERARVIWVKLRLKQAFPNTFTEALNPDNGFFGSTVSLPPLPTYKQYLSNAGITYNGTSVPEAIPSPDAYVESSVCLLMALQQGQGGGGIDAEDIGQSFIQQFQYKSATPTSHTVQVIIDGWGKPVAFCRWPWNCYALNPGSSPPTAAAQTGPNNDPGDPRGLLCDYYWQTASVVPTYPTRFNSLLGYTPAIWASGTPTTGGHSQSYVLTPVIVSGGADLTIGVDPSNGGLETGNNPAGTQAAFDDIFSTQLQ
jgi:prepilin-type N-terminal cleavage/methylation domain-containing protein